MKYPEDVVSKVCVGAWERLLVMLCRFWGLLYGHGHVAGDFDRLLFIIYLLCDCTE